MKNKTEQQISNVITVGHVTAAQDDSGIDSISQAEYDEKPVPFNVVLPYGISANIPAGATVVLLSVSGDSGCQVGIPYFQENRFRDLKEWEVKIGSYKTKANVFFNDDGQIEIVPKTGKEMILSGGTEPAIKGTTYASKYDTHVHATAFGPSGTTTAPTDATCFNDKVLI